MSYATIADVLYPFPRFQQGLPNNISSNAIQTWLDEGKAIIRARFLRRSIDPDNPASLGWTPPLAALTADQANVLRVFNAAYGIVTFGGAAYNQLNEGELKIVERQEKIWESMSQGTDGVTTARYALGNDGVYDALFTPSAAHVQVTPQFAGWAGADFDPKLINNRTTGTHFIFEKGKVY